MVTITSKLHDPDLLDLPWDVPLEQWPDDLLVDLPRGISRHVVRFVSLNGSIYALKEIGRWSAEREYDLLRDLRRLSVPCVEPLGVVSDRRSSTGEDLETVVVTRHLRFALPYRALFSRRTRPETTAKALDALAALLVRLHLAGFYWGDCSLSNVLFRRDANAFAAYLVDAETGELHPRLTEGQRTYDVELARTNIIGELMDLEAGGLLDPALDAFEIGQTIAFRYLLLWAELTEPEMFEDGAQYRIEERIRRLNALGFDVAELDISTDVDGRRLQVQPKVVDAGHHQRRLLRLTGLDAEENQARRLLNDLDRFRAATDQQLEDEALVANQWLSTVFVPVVRAVPASLRGKLQPAQLFHEVLEHRWFLSEQAGHDVGTQTAVRGYVRDVLPQKPDEREAAGLPVGKPAPRA